jgi:hypothetical protein
MLRKRAAPENEIHTWFANLIHSDIRFEEVLAQLLLDPLIGLEDLPKSELTELDIKAMAITRWIFPDVYQEVSEDFWTLHEITFLESLYSRVWDELPNPDASNFLPEDYILERVPLVAYGFCWDIVEEVYEFSEFLECPPIRPIVHTFFSAVQDPNTKKKKGWLDSTDEWEALEDELEALEHDFEDEAEDEDEFDQELEDILADDEASNFYEEEELLELYKGIGKFHYSIMIDACNILCDSLMTAAVRNNSRIYNNIAILLHYLFTKHGPEPFADSQESVDTQSNLMFREWDRHNYEEMCQIQMLTDELMEMTYKARDYLEDDPIMLNILIINYQSLVRSLKADTQDENRPKYMVVNSSEFARGIEFPTQRRHRELSDNLNWPMPTMSRSTDHYLTESQFHYPCLYPWRQSSDDGLIYL